MNKLQEFLNKNQCALKSIRKFERIHGDSFYCVGGKALTKEFLETLDLVPGQHVLDLGCGSGGATFLMAQHYGVNVHGVDISNNMTYNARCYLSQMEQATQDLIKFEVADIQEMHLEPESYDAIHSRETLMYVHDKEALFKKAQGWLRPGGRLFATFFCRGTSKDRSQEIEEDIRIQGWNQHLTVAEYGEFLRKADFKEVRAQDISNLFYERSQKELQSLKSMRKSFIQDFGEGEYIKSVKRYEHQLPASKAGILAWGVFEATK